jgi:hypothetical protein
MRSGGERSYDGAAGIVYAQSDDVAALQSQSFTNLLPKADTEATEWAGLMIGKSDWERIKVSD